MIVMLFHINTTFSWLIKSVWLQFTRRINLWCYIQTNDCCVNLHHTLYIICNCCYIPGTSPTIGTSPVTGFGISVVGPRDVSLPISGNGGVLDECKSLLLSAGC